MVGARYSSTWPFVYSAYMGTWLARTLLPLRIAIFTILADLVDIQKIRWLYFKHFTIYLLKTSVLRMQL